MSDRGREASDVSARSARTLQGADVADQEESWPVTDSDRPWTSDWIVAIRQDTIHAPDDDAEQPETMTRAVLEHPGAVVVLAVDEDERVVCLRQYRQPARRRLIELPAGVRDGGDEEPLEVAKRELREEAELAADHWEPLLELLPSPGILAERQHVFLATGLRHASRGDFELRHEEARLEVVRVPAAELVAAVLDRRVADSPLVAAILAWQVRRDRGSPA